MRRIDPRWGEGVLVGAVERGVENGGWPSSGANGEPCYVKQSSNLARQIEPTLHHRHGGAICGRWEGLGARLRACRWRGATALMAQCVRTRGKWSGELAGVVMLLATRWR